MTRFASYIRLLVFATALLGACAPLLSQTRLDSIQHLNEVVVTARTYNEVIPAQKLSQAQLTKLNAVSVADALRYFAGVQIKDYGGMGGLKTVNVRNMGSHHVGVFYDGLQVGNAQNGIVDLGRFSLDDMEEVALYNGQKSEIFQSAKDFASSSAVYLQTRRPRFSDGKRTHVTARFKTGSIQLVNSSLRIEQQLSDRLSASISGEYIQSDGKYKYRYRRLSPDGSVAYDTTATRHNSDIEALRTEAALFGSHDNGCWQAKLYYYQSDRGLPGAIVKNVFYNGERQTDRNFLAQASWTQEITSRYKMQLKSKYAYDYTHYLSRDTVLFLDHYVTKKMQYDNTYYQQDFYLSTVHQYALLPFCDISLAVDYQYNKLNATRRGVNTPFSYPQRHSLLASLATALTFGQFKAQAALLSTSVFEQARNQTPAPDKHEITPSLFIGYSPLSSGRLQLRAFYKRIFRMPTFNDLYYDQIGYSQLKPEFTDQFDIGATYSRNYRTGLLEFVSVKADGYWARITDKIIASPTGSSFRWMMTNMGLVKNRGIDASASLKLRLGKVGVSGNLCYSYARAQDFTKINGQKISSYGDQIPYTPWHSGSAICGVDFYGYSLNYSFIYVGERYDGAVNNIARNHVEPWYTHDLSLQKSFVMKGITLKPAVEVNNLLNQYYDVVLNYPMPGRNFRLSLTVTL